MSIKSRVAELERQAAGPDMSVIFVCIAGGDEPEACTAQVFGGGHDPLNFKSREDETFESFRQRVSDEVLAGQGYRLSFDAMQTIQIGGEAGQ